MTLARLGTIALLLGLAGCIPAPGAEAPDGGSTPPDAAAPRSDAGVAAPELGDRCYDGVDDDLDGAADCADSDCASNAVCCVGSGADGCCDPIGTTIELPLACADQDASACFASDPSLSVFGEVLPVIESGALVPQGGRVDGGVVIGDAIDPRGVDITLTATIDTPANRCTDCADAAGIGLLDRLPAPGEQAIVLFGVVATGSRAEITVIVADEVVARTPLTPGSASYRLEMDVSGHGRVLVGEAMIAELDSVPLPMSLRAAVFGRTENRPADVSAVSVTQASVTLKPCDAPTAIVRRSTPVVPWSGSTWTPREVRRPSVVTWVEDTTTKRLMAFAFEGAIYLAQRTAGGEYRNASFDPGPPAFELPAELVEARDPWLVIEDARFHLYFVGVDESGATSVWRASGGSVWDTTFGTAEKVLDPAAFEIASIAAPAVVVGDPTWSMIARAGTERGPRLVRWISTDGVEWTLRGGSLDAATWRAPQPDDLFAFARDDLGAPALVTMLDRQQRPVQRLYYAGRRGTRWSIGLMVSSDGDRFLPLGRVLDGGVGFDALGVADPAPVVEDGSLLLYYAGTDGSAWKIGVAGPAGTVGE